MLPTNLFNISTKQVQKIDQAHCSNQIRIITDPNSHSNTTSSDHLHIIFEPKKMMQIFAIPNQKSSSHDLSEVSSIQRAR